MADVQVGDALLGANGRPCVVTAKSAVHDRPCYQVVFTDGSRVVCDNVHLWSVHVPSGSTQRYEEMVVDADQLHELVRNRPATVRGRRRLFIRAAAALDLPFVDDLPLDPWLLACGSATERLGPGVSLSAGTIGST
jgi:hypothetical protein